MLQYEHRWIGNSVENRGSGNGAALFQQAQGLIDYVFATLL